MSRVKDIRERWIAEVLQTDAVNNSCKVVLFAMYRHMTDSGRISYPRERLAAEVGFKSEQRITDRIKEAKDAGLLDVVHPGYRGMTAIYEAMLPRTKAPRNGVPIAGKVTGNGVPFSGSLSGADSSTKGPRDRVANARATKRSHGTEPAPAGSRAVSEADSSATCGTYGDEWLPTPSKRLSSDSTGRVA